MGDKVAVVAILDKEAFNGVELPNQAFVMATTTTNVMTGMQPSMRLDMNHLIDADKWCTEQTGRGSKGMGISGIITSPVWFCQKVGNFLKGLV